MEKWRESDLVGGSLKATCVKSSQKVRSEFLNWFRESLQELAEIHDDPEKIAWMAWQIAWAKAYESGRKVGANQARWSKRRKR